MGYIEERNKALESYNKLSQKFNEEIISDRYIDIKENMPFKFLNAKHQAEILQMFKETKKLTVHFERVDEAVLFLENILTVRKQVNSLLDDATFIIKINEDAEKINDIVEKSPFLSENLKVSMDRGIVNISNECIKVLPDYKDILTKEFKKAYTENCINDLNKNGMDVLIDKKYIEEHEIKELNPVGSPNYTENMKYLQQKFNIDELYNEKYTVRVVGTSHQNDDGSSRQEIIKSMSKEKGEIKLKCNMTKWIENVGKEKDAIEIIWKDKLIGYVDQESVDKLHAKYDNLKVFAELENISGGNGAFYGCKVNLMVKGDLKEKAEEKADETPEK